jgi:hypothetical protein
MATDIRFFVKEHALTRDFPVNMIYGELYGPIISGEFAGSQMIRVTECPEWALTKYDNALVGRLIPTALINHGFEYPLRDAKTGKFRKFLVYAEQDNGDAPHEDISALIASSDSFAEALEHAYAHGRYKNQRALYLLVNGDESKPISQSLFDPDAPEKSWVWEAAK